MLTSLFTGFGILLTTYVTEPVDTYVVEPTVSVVKFAYAPPQTCTYEKVVSADPNFQTYFKIKSRNGISISKVEPLSCQTDRPFANVTNKGDNDNPIYNEEQFGENAI